MSARTGPPTVGLLTATPHQVEALIAAVIVDTYPAGIADRVVERTVSAGRIERLVDERTWFEARGPDDTVVGVAAVHLCDPTTAYLSCHFVAVRGAGIGRALTGVRLDWARDHGAGRAVATTHPWNTASLTNLAGHGFVVVGEAPDGWVGDGVIVELAAAL